MSPKTDVRLSSGQRLARGLRYTAVGPVDVTRGAMGLGVHGAQSAATRVRHGIDRSRLAKEIAEARKPKRNRRRPLMLAAVGAVVLAGGAVAFSIVRRSTQPEPSPLPPSVEVAPRP